MKLTKTLQCALAFILVAGKLHAQQASSTPVQMPASPNVAMLERFTEFPVSLYTGVPNIGVPIHSIALKGVTVPISLSYHASGVKVDDVASTVGLGWSLQAGGMVTIQQNGLMDENSRFGNTHPQYQKIKNLSFQMSYQGPLIECSELTLYNVSRMDLLQKYSGNDIVYFRGIRDGNEDSEPDLYTYNFLDKGGKFFQDEGGVFRNIPYSNTRFTRIVDANGFSKGYSITDESGNVFDFTTLEESTVRSWNSCASGQPPSEDSRRSYLLTRITTLYGETVNFEYSSHRYSYPLTHQWARAAYSNQLMCGRFNGGNNLAYSCITQNENFLFTQRLEKITASDGTVVDFTYSSARRKDLPGDTKLTLKEIKITHARSTKEKKFLLETDYYESGSTSSTNPNDFRLKLKSVQEVGKPSYKFDYNTQLLPARTSYAQDHWGYYNGAGNTTLLPKDEYHGFENGGDRTPNIQHTSAGMLTRVTYPTGGFTEYSFEANKYWEPSVTVDHVKIAGPYLLSQPDATVSENFTLPVGTNTVRIVYNNTYDNKNYHNDRCIVSLYGPTGLIRQFYLAGDLKLTLESGIPYRVEISTEGNLYSAEVALSWFEKQYIQPHEATGGGLRVKQIDSFDANGVRLLGKKFEYTTANQATSSGVAMYRPQYLSLRSEEKTYTDQECHSCGTMVCDLLEQSSSSTVPLSFSNGYIVGYREVTSFSEEKEKSGYTYNRFIIDNNNTGPSNFPFAPLVTYDWVNGSMLEQTEYAYIDGELKPVQSIYNTYNYTAFSPTDASSIAYRGYGAKISLNTYPQYCNDCENCIILAVKLPDISFGVAHYRLYSSRHYLEKTEAVSYDGPNGPLTTTTRYHYGNPLYTIPTKVVTTTSTGEEQITNIKYPFDYPTATYVGESALGIKSLLDKNIITAPIEKQEWLGNRLVSSELTLYKGYLPSKLLRLPVTATLANFVPSALSGGQLTFDARYEEEISFDKYNTLGNITQYSARGNRFSSYQWGYHDRLVVAEFKNAVEADVYFSNFEEKKGWGTGLQYSTDRSYTGSVSGKVEKLTAGEMTVHSNQWLNVSLAGTKQFRYSGWVYSDGPSAEIFLFMKRSGETGYYSYVDRIETTERNKWVYLEKVFDVPADVTQLNLRLDNNGMGTVWFDDIRLHPAEAQLTTYTYDPLVGVTAITDANGQTVFHEYDALGRLKLTKDGEGNILKTYEYNYLRTYQENLGNGNH